MSYYTVVPTVRNTKNTDYITNFCEGKWKVFHDGNWIQLLPENTRVRDKNNRTWLEVCSGHKVEIELDDPNLDCKCYSKNFNDALNRSISARVFEKSQSDIINFVLYGKIIQVYDHEPYLYIVYYTDDGKKSLKLYIINKNTSDIDNIFIDSVDRVDRVAIDVEDFYAVIYCDNIRYKLSSDYTINADVVEYTGQKFQHSGAYYSVTDALYRESTKLFDVKSISNSMLIYEHELCLATYDNNRVRLYNTNGTIVAETISDAEKVFLFNIADRVISIEGYDSYIKIKDVEDESTT